MHPYTTGAELQKIAARARSASQRERAFGLQLAELLERHGFPDFEVVNGYYRASPRPDGLPIEAVLTKYRGEVVHRAFFDFLSGKIDVPDVYLVQRHLHDIALRLAFKYLGYTERYRSPTCPSDPDRSVDWVTSATPATELGYGSSPFDL